MRIVDNLSYEEAKEIKIAINKYFEDKGITDEILDNIKKNSNQIKRNYKLNLIIKS